ncbi:hypothetical protein GCM10028824_08880 [Hymenobacter segetis]
MKFFVILLCMSLTVCYLPVAGQVPHAPNMRPALPRPARPDTARVRQLLQAAQQWSSTDIPRAIRLSQQALVLARQLRDSAGEGQALLRLSTLHRRHNDFALARRLARQAQALFVRLRDRQGQGRAWLQLSLIDMLQGNPVPALASALKGLRLAEQAGDLQTKIRLQATLGDIYYKMGSYDEALPVLQIALAGGLRTHDQQVTLLALNGLGNSFQMLKKWPQAIYYYQRALVLSRQLGDAIGETGSETSLAEVYGLQGNPAAALAHGLRAQQLVRATHDDYNLPAVELMLARAYLLAHQTDSAVALARHGLQLSQQARSNENIRNASDILAQAYAQRHDFAQAYYFRNLHLAYNDTLSGEDTRRRTSRLRYDYELTSKQAQIDLLTKTRQLQAQKAARQRLQLNGLLAGLASVLLIAGLLWRNIYLKQRANRHLNEMNTQIAAHRDQLNRTLTELQDTQAQLVQREKMASLGEMTAGVAHEIQNPLNFVTNFSDLNVELLAELQEELAGEHLSSSGGQNIQQLLDDLTLNQVKIQEHGARADRIVKRMLEHSHPSSGTRQATDLNALAGDSLRLAYHGWCARNKDFSATLTTDLDPQLQPVPAVAQDLSRVLMNLLTNAFYAVTEKGKHADAAYRPEVQVQTRQTDHAVEIRVRDNGAGIPLAVREKIFQPFFTTKPTGEGTGLGLSLSYDVITKGHGGVLSVESQEGEYCQFTISLPVTVEKVMEDVAT